MGHPVTFALLFATTLVQSQSPPAGPKRGSGWVPPPPPASAPDDVKTLAREWEALYYAREKPGNLDKVLALTREAGKKHPDSFDVQWRLALSLCWASENSKDNARRRQLAEEGWEAGKRATQLNPKVAEGHYFTAYCVGQYSLTIGIVTALRQGIESKFRDPLLEAAKYDEAVDHGGIYNSLGRYKYELPWPKRSYGESVRYLRKAIAINPQNLRARVYLAESLLARDDKGDRAEAEQLLKEVAGAPVGRYDTAEELLAKDLGTEAAKKLR
jgi:tetratricopeptide (TPR) repeat protein